MAVNYRALSSNGCVICPYSRTRNIFHFKNSTLILNFENQFPRVLVEIEVSIIHSLVETWHNCIDFSPKVEMCRRSFVREIWKNYYTLVLHGCIHRLQGSLDNKCAFLNIHKAKTPKLLQKLPLEWWSCSTKIFCVWLIWSCSHIIICKANFLQS